MNVLKRIAAEGLDIAAMKVAIIRNSTTAKNGGISYHDDVVVREQLLQMLIKTTSYHGGYSDLGEYIHIGGSRVPTRFNHWVKKYDTDGVDVLTYVSKLQTLMNTLPVGGEVVIGTSSHGVEERTYVKVSEASYVLVKVYDSSYDTDAREIYLYPGIRVDVAVDLGLDPQQLSSTYHKAFDMAYNDIG